MSDAATGVLRACFWSLLIAMGLGLERLWLHRRSRYARSPRWRANIPLMLIVRIFGNFPRLWLYVPLAVWLARREIGLLYHVGWPLWVKWAVIWLWADLMHYWAHRLNHRVPWLWRIHSIHHTDLEVDVTTTDRVHPLHTFINVPIAWCNLVLGYGAAGVAFKAAKNVFSITSHLNVDLPFGLDGILRWVFITPNVHLLHHSAAREEQGANFGSLLSIWDRLFGTYRDPSPAGLETMTYGVAELQDQARLGFKGLLLLPFMPQYPEPTLAPRPNRPGDRLYRAPSPG